MASVMRLDNTLPTTVRTITANQSITNPCHLNAYIVHANK